MSHVQGRGAAVSTTRSDKCFFPVQSDAGHTAFAATNIRKQWDPSIMLIADTRISSLSCLPVRAEAGIMALLRRRPLTKAWVCHRVVPSLRSITIKKRGSRVTNSGAWRARLYTHHNCYLCAGIRGRRNLPRHVNWCFHLNWRSQREVKRWMGW